MMCAVFQMAGLMFLLSARLTSEVRCCVASVPKCFECLMLMSGPSELLVLLVLIALSVCLFFGDIDLMVILFFRWFCCWCV